MPFDRTRLLKHARDVYGGQLSDDLLAWADFKHAADCAMPESLLTTMATLEPLERARLGAPEA